MMKSGYECQCLSWCQIVVFDGLTLNNKLTIIIFYLSSNFSQIFWKRFFLFFTEELRTNSLLACINNGDALTSTACYSFINNWGSITMFSNILGEFYKDKNSIGKEMIYKDYSLVLQLFLWPFLSIIELGFQYKKYSACMYSARSNICCPKDAVSRTANVGT